MQTSENPAETKKRVYVILPKPERIYNSHYGNGVPAMFTSYCCPAKRQTLPKCRNGVVDPFGP